MNKHDFEKTPITIGQVWKMRNNDEVVITRYDQTDEEWCWDGTITTCDGHTSYDSFRHNGTAGWGTTIDYGDLVELIYDPNIVATPEKKEPCYNRKEIIQAILDEKIILFRVDEGETWQEVKDNDWVLRMIADKTEYCFKVKPDTENLFILVNPEEAYTGLFTQQIPFNERESAIKCVFENNILVDVELVERL